MAEPIEIIIRKGSGGEGTGFGIPGAKLSEQAIDNHNNSKKSEKDTLSQKAIVMMGLNFLKREILFGINQYNNMTGNYINQMNIEIAMEHIGNIHTIATSFVGGLALTGGNPIGGAVSALVAATGIAVNYGNKAIGIAGNIIKLNTYSNIMQERSGGVYANDSRGTYN